MTTPYTPTPEAIAQECLVIRAAWTADEHEARLTHAVDMRLMASILRPMAIDAGLTRDDNNERE